MRAALVAVLVLLALTSCSGSPSTPAPDRRAGSPVASASPAPPGPAAPVARAVPCASGEQAWVIGQRNRITGEVFGRPLTSPPSQDHDNKILWRAHRAGIGDLVISGTLNGSTLQVQHRVEGGPGPSIIDMPQPGCWTFSLTWRDACGRLECPAIHDVVAVRYVRPT